MEEKLKKNEVSPEMCMKAGKCLMMAGIHKVSKEEYMSKSNEEKDKEDEAEVLKE